MSVRGASSSEATTIGSGKSDHATNGTMETHDETTGIDIDITATVDVNNSGSTETRPRNVALLACIKY